MFHVLPKDDAEGIEDDNTRREGPPFVAKFKLGHDVSQKRARRWNSVVEAKQIQQYLTLTGYAIARNTKKRKS